MLYDSLFAAKTPAAFNSVFNENLGVLFVILSYFYVMFTCMSQSRKNCPCCCVCWHGGFWIRGEKCIPRLPRKSHWLSNTYAHRETILVGYCGTIWLQLKTEGRGLSLSLWVSAQTETALLQCFCWQDHMKQDILSGTGLPVENVCFNKMKCTLGLIQNTWKAGTFYVSYVNH